MKNAYTMLLALSLSLAGVSSSHAATKYLFGHYGTPIFYSTADQTAANANNWLPQNEDDVRAAMEMGLDGLIFDAFSGGAESAVGSWNSAADALGATNFKSFISWDMSGDSGCPAACVPGIAASAIIASTEAIYNNPHTFRYNGLPVLSTYGGGDMGNAWWQNNVLTPLANAGYPVFFLPFFDRPDPNGTAPTLANWQALIASFPVLNGTTGGYFGFNLPASPPFRTTDPNIGPVANYKWSALDGWEAAAQALHGHNPPIPFMAPFEPTRWDECSSVRQGIVTMGGLGMDNWWKSIINVQNPELIEMVTWSDYGEGTFITGSNMTPLPNVPSGSTIETPTHIGYYELAKYYIQWYRTGVTPTIIKDGVFWFHRMQTLAGVPSADPCSIGAPPSWSQAGLLEDNMYVTTALTAPGVLTVVSGSSTQNFNMPAGLSTIKVPFQAGTQTIQISRNGVTLTQATSHSITSTPVTYNFGMWSGYSIANGTNSATWAPSNKFLTGYVADWFGQKCH